MSKYPIATLTREFARDLAGHFITNLEENGITPTKDMAIALGSALAKTAKQHAVAWSEED